MKQILGIGLLLLALSFNLTACTKEAPVDPPTPEEPTPSTPPGNNNDDNDQNPTMTRLHITIGGQTIPATLYDNPATKAWLAMLPLTLNMNDYNSNEKVCSLSRSLPTSASNPGTIQTGDIMLYGSNSLVLFYKTFATSFSYTRIGRADNPAGLAATLGTGRVTIKFESGPE